MDFIFNGVIDISLETVSDLRTFLHAIHCHEPLYINFSRRTIFMVSHGYTPMRGDIKLICI